MGGGWASPRLLSSQPLRARSHLTAKAGPRRASLCAASSEQRGKMTSMVQVVVILSLLVAPTPSVGMKRFKRSLATDDFDHPRNLDPTPPDPEQDPQREAGGGQQPQQDPQRESGGGQQTEPEPVREGGGAGGLEQALHPHPVKPVPTRVPRPVVDHHLPGTEIRPGRKRQLSRCGVAWRKRKGTRAIWRTRTSGRDSVLHSVLAT